MAMASFIFGEDTKTLWNQCVHQCVAAAAQDLPTAGAAADPPHALYYHCNTLFLCRTNSDLELNCDGLLDSVVVEHPGEPLRVSHEVITIDKKTSTCFYISNVSGLFDKKARLKSRMEYCAKQNIGQFASCAKEVTQFEQIMKDNKAQKKKRKAEVKAQVEAQAQIKRWKEEEEEREGEKMASVTAQRPLQSSLLSRPEPCALENYKIVQRVMRVEIPLGTLAINDERDTLMSLFVKLNLGWELLSAGISAMAL